MTSVNLTNEMAYVQRLIYLANRCLVEVMGTFDADQHYPGLSETTQNDIYRRTRISIERLRVLRTLVYRADERIDRC